MNCTFASSGSLAICSTAFATWFTSIIGSVCGSFDASSVSALPMSIWPQAMSYLRPSSEVDLVSPVIACLDAVYGAEFARGVCAEIDPLLMMRPPRGVLILHQPERLLRAQERAGEIGVDHFAPLFVGHVFERHERRLHARVVEQHIEPPELLVRRIEQRAHRLRASSHRRRPRSAPARHPPDLRRHRRELFACRPASTTRKPSRRNASAVALPMPLPAPVISATFFSGFRSFPH